MLAFDMGMPVAYDVPITLASLLVVVVTGLGIYVVGKRTTIPWRLVGGGTAMGVGWPPCTTLAWPRCGFAAGTHLLRYSTASITRPRTLELPVGRDRT